MEDTIPTMKRNHRSELTKMLKEINDVMNSHLTNLLVPVLEETNNINKILLNVPMISKMRNDFLKLNQKLVETISLNKELKSENAELKKEIKIAYERMKNITLEVKELPNTNNDDIRLNISNESYGNNKKVNNISTRLAMINNLNYFTNMISDEEEEEDDNEIKSINLDSLTVEINKFKQKSIQNPQSAEEDKDCEEEEMKKFGLTEKMESEEDEEDYNINSSEYTSSNPTDEEVEEEVEEEDEEEDEEEVEEEVEEEDEEEDEEEVEEEVEEEDEEEVEEEDEEEVEEEDEEEVEEEVEEEDEEEVEEEDEEEVEEEDEEEVEEEDEEEVEEEVEEEDEEEVEEEDEEEVEEEDEEEVEEEEDKDKEAFASIVLKAQQAGEYASIDTSSEKEDEEEDEVEDVTINGIKYLATNTDNGIIYKLDNEGDVMYDEDEEPIEAGRYKNGIPEIFD